MGLSLVGGLERLFEYGEKRVTSCYRLSGVSVLGDKLQSAAMQVCLAAEKCGNLDFDVRNDMWNSSEGLFCNTSVHRTITFWDILTKVSRPQHGHSIVYQLCKVSTTSFSPFAVTELITRHNM